jgi:hypothetical protein
MGKGTFLVVDKGPESQNDGPRYATYLGEGRANPGRSSADKIAANFDERLKKPVVVYVRDKNGDVVDSSQPQAAGGRGRRRSHV